MPPDATIINRPSTFYEEHKQVVWTLVGVFAAMVLFILALMNNIRRRQLAEKELTMSNMEMRALYIEVQTSQENLFKQYEALKLTKEALRESEGKYHSLVDNLNVGIYRSTVDADRGFIQLIPALVEILGYDSMETLKKGKYCRYLSRSLPTKRVS